MNKSLTKLLSIPMVILFIGMMSCRKDNSNVDTPEIETPTIKTADFDHQIALEWMTLFLEMERFTPGYRPPISARASAYVGLAGYEAALPGMEDQFNSMEGQLAGLQLPHAHSGVDYHWPSAVHAAYGTMVTHMFPTAPATQQQKLFALKQKYVSEFSATVPIDVFNRSDEFGTAIGNAIFKWSQTDQLGHEAFLRNNDPNYTPPKFEGSWQPTYPDYSPALLPYWGRVRTFAATSDDKVPLPLSFSTDTNSPFYIQAKECMILSNRANDGSNHEDRWIADFWSDDCPILTFTPSARWIAVANQVIKNHEVPLDQAVYTYAKIGIGLNDAGVRCWAEKYTYNLLRPIDYVRDHMGQTQWNTIMCPDGSGNYYTPPFPAYPSGHATFGAVSAEILTDIFGSHYSMTDRSHEGRQEFLSTPRTFGNFYEMAAENAYSRVPLGVHFRMDADAGLRLGYAIGRKINNLNWKKS